MPSINWKNPEEKSEYYRKHARDYRQKHPRIQLTFSREEYEEILASASKYGITGRDITKHVRKLAVEAAKMGLGQSVERPPRLDQETVDEMLFLLHSCANNINQTAYHLNSKALEKNVTEVVGEGESITILDGIFEELKTLHTTIQTLAHTNATNPTNTNK